MSKKKIFSDPLYGFISVNDELLFKIIEHPLFQRLRRIRQLGLTDYVYPGALHTRFHHAIGAMHLMGLVLNNLKSKGHKISDQEYQAAQIAILLHDVGHGPFSHTLEYTLIEAVKHEDISLAFMHKINQDFGGELDLAIKIFTNQYHRKFLYSLVSSQLDIDRLDYLNRDSFFTGVSEGTIGLERIIQMLDVADNELVVEENGMYSIEHFLGARRLMYWQVYLHKTAVSAEKMMALLIKRAQYLSAKGVNLPVSNALNFFLNNKLTGANFLKNEEALKHYTSLDDFDIWGAIKAFEATEDRVLAMLSTMLLNRRLFKVVLSNEPFPASQVQKTTQSIAKELGLSSAEAKFLIDKGILSNSAYVSEKQKINILMKSGEIVDVAKASDLPNIKAMSKIVRKHYLCWPKSVTLRD